MKTRKDSFPVYLAGFTGLALVVLAIICWMGGFTNPLANVRDIFGRSLAFLPQPAAHVVVAVIGILAVVAAVFARRDGRFAGLIRVAAIGGLVLALDVGVLAVLGYLPFMVVSLVTGHAERLGVLMSPTLALQIGIAAAAASLLWIQVVRVTGSAMGKDPVVTHERARVRTRRWTVIAMVTPLVYVISRVLMAVRLPGLDLPPGDEVGSLAPFGLALAGVGGVLLTWGLIRPWGERFPRWIPWLAGKPVPVDLAAVPPLAVALLVLAALKLLVSPPILAEIDLSLNTVVMILPVYLWPLWAVALVLAAINYRIRRNTENPFG